MAVRAVRGATQVLRDEKEHPDAELANVYLHGTELLRVDVPPVLDDEPQEANPS